MQHRLFAVCLTFVCAAAFAQSFPDRPVRVIVPKRYAWKGAKWIREITFMNRDILGFWELRGYSNTADPWTDDRFS